MIFWRQQLSRALLASAILLIPLVLAACGEAEEFPNTEPGPVGAQDPAGEILFVSNHNVMRWSNGTVDQITKDVFAAAPSWAPAGDRFAYVQIHEDYSEIVIANREGEPLVEVTNHATDLEPFSEEHVFNAAWAWDPEWSPVKEELLYVSDKDGLDVYSRPLYLWIAQGFDIDPYPLPAAFSISGSQEGPSYSPDGQAVAFAVRVDHGNGVRSMQIWTLNLESAVWETLVADTDGAYDPVWSPDGQDIAYVQRVGEGNDIWIAPVDGGEPYQLTDFGAIAEPAWSPDGSQIAYIQLVGTEFEIWVADVERGENGQLQVKDPEKLVSAENIDAQSGLSWINP